MSAPTRQPIRSGIFIMPFHPPSKPLAQNFDEDLELIVRAEELGFSEFWIGEHQQAQRIAGCPHPGPLPEGEGEEILFGAIP